MNETLTMLGQTLPITISPIIDIYVLSIITSLFITLVNKYLSDQKTIKRVRAEMKELQKKMRKVMKEDPKKAQLLQKEIMKKNMENFKFAFNPKIMIITFIPAIYIFMLVKNNYSSFGNILNVFGFFSVGCVGTYIIFSIINSILLKKILDVA